MFYKNLQDVRYVPIVVFSSIGRKKRIRWKGTTIITVVGDESFFSLGPSDNSVLIFLYWINFSTSLSET